MRILVVEDQPKVASFIVKGMKEEMYSVDLAEDGEEGLRMAQMNNYDLIIQDLMLPGINGYQAIETLRKGGNKTPIIILSAKDGIDDRIKGLDFGADDYLCKPFSFGELLARVRAILRRGKETGDPILRIADLELDPVSHEVIRDGQKIILTVKEYALLEYLLRNTGRVLSRTLITEHVWDINFDTDTNLVDVYIRYLRKKMDTEFEVKLIQTVRGIGYVLKDETS